MNPLVERKFKVCGRRYFEGVQWCKFCLIRARVPFKIYVSVPLTATTKVPHLSLTLVYDLHHCRTYGGGWTSLDTDSRLVNIKNICKKAISVVLLVEFVLLFRVVVVAVL